MLWRKDVLSVWKTLGRGSRDVWSSGDGEPLSKRTSTKYEKSIRVDQCLVMVQYSQSQLSIDATWLQIIDGEISMFIDFL